MKSQGSVFASLSLNFLFSFRFHVLCLIPCILCFEVSKEIEHHFGIWHLLPLKVVKCFDQCFQGAGDEPLLL